MEGRTSKTLCLSSICLTSVLAKFYKDRSSSESGEEVTFVCYPAAQLSVTPPPLNAGDSCL